MTKFIETEAATSFIETADSRQTSPEIMRAIAFFARDVTEAESLWDGSGLGRVAHISDIWENATNNGQRDDTELLWDGRSLASVMADQ